MDSEDSKIENINKGTMEDEGPNTTSYAATATGRPSLTRYLMAFSIVYFVVVIVFFYIGGTPVGNVRLQDVLTMLNPLLLVPLFFRIAWIVDPTTAQQQQQQPSMVQHVIFLLAAVIYVHGDGMHLAANAINHYRDVIGDETAKDVVYLYDEELGHYYPYAGLLLLHILWLIRQYQLPFRAPFPGWSSRVGLIIFGFLHGFTLFINFIEGHFGIPGVVFFVLVVAFVALQGNRLAYDPVYVFSLAYASMGILLVIIWAVWQKGLPEFSEVGLI